MSVMARISIVSETVTLSYVLVAVSAPRYSQYLDILHLKIDQQYSAILALPSLLATIYTSVMGVLADKYLREDTFKIQSIDNL